MAENNKNTELSEFEDYFSDDLLEINLELERSNELYEGMMTSIKNLQSKQDFRGSIHYLLSFYENIIELQNHKQNALKNRVSLKKIIMDYAKKNTSNQNADELMAEFKILIDEAKKKAADEAKKNPISIPQVSDSALDEEIDSLLEEENE